MKHNKQKKKEVPTLKRHVYKNETNKKWYLKSISFFSRYTTLHVYLNRKQQCTCGECHNYTSCWKHHLQVEHGLQISVGLYSRFYVYCDITQSRAQSPALISNNERAVNITVLSMDQLTFIYCYRWFPVVQATIDLSRFCHDMMEYGCKLFYLQLELVVVQEQLGFTSYL